MPVAVGTPPVAVTNQAWYRVKVSGDGNTIVMVANGFGGSSGALASSDMVFPRSVTGASFSLRATPGK